MKCRRDKVGHCHRSFEPQRTKKNVPIFVTFSNFQTHVRLDL